MALFLKWLIKGYDDYGFSTEKDLYNLKTMRKLKKSVINGSIGYSLNGKFMPLDKLKPLIYIHKESDCPF